MGWRLLLLYTPSRELPYATGEALKKKKERKKEKGKGSTNENDFIKLKKFKKMKQVKR